MTLLQSILRRSLLTGMLTLALAGRAAIPIPPELEAATESGRIREINLRAEASLREKIEVGKQRYVEQQVFRQELIQGMTASAVERRQEIEGVSSRLNPQAEEFEFDYNLLGWVAIVLGIIYQVVRYCRTHELGDLDFGLHKLPTPPKPATVPTPRDPNWQEFITAVHLPTVNETRKKIGHLAALKSGTGLAVKICVDIAPGLQALITEPQVKQRLQTLFEPCGLRCVDDAPVWLAVNIQGNPLDPTKAFSHSEKLLLLENESGLVKYLPGKASTPEVLWGAEHLGYAHLPELPGDVLDVLQVFAQMFREEQVSDHEPAPAEAKPPAEPTTSPAAAPELVKAPVCESVSAS